MYNTRLTSGQVARDYYYGVHAKRYNRNLKMAKTCKNMFDMQKRDIALWRMTVDCIDRTLTFEERNKDSRRAQIV